MDVKDIQKLLTVLQQAYPATYKDMTGAEMKAAVVLYYKAFGEYPYELAEVALMNYIKTNKYPPTIAGLQEQIDIMTRTSDAEGWAAITRAVGNAIYHAAEEFEKLPEECKAFIGSAQALRDLAMTDAGTVNTVTRGQFMKHVGDIRMKQQAMDSLPEEIKALLADGIKKIGE